jgi:DNA-binding MarR family transcriptional regulator
MMPNIMNSEPDIRPGQDLASSEQVDRALRSAERVTRALLPLTPRDVLMLDVTTAQFKVMFVLFLHGPLRISTLAEELGVSLPTMTVTIDRLVKRSIVLREDDPNDRRVVFCRLSEHGQQVLNGLWSSARERTRQMLSVLSADELGIVEQALEILLKTGKIAGPGTGKRD